jgi:hypothetical protein
MLAGGWETIGDVVRWILLGCSDGGDGGEELGMFVCFVNVAVGPLNRTWGRRPSRILCEGRYALVGLFLSGVGETPSFGNAKGDLPLLSWFVRRRSHLQELNHCVKRTLASPTNVWCESFRGHSALHSPLRCHFLQMSGGPGLSRELNFLN